MPVFEPGSRPWTEQNIDALDRSAMDPLSCSWNRLQTCLVDIKIQNITHFVLNQFYGLCAVQNSRSPRLIKVHSQNLRWVPLDLTCVVDFNSLLFFFLLFSFFIFFYYSGNKTLQENEVLIQIHITISSKYLTPQGGANRMSS